MFAAACHTDATFATLMLHLLHLNRKCLNVNCLLFLPHCMQYLWYIHTVRSWCIHCYICWIHTWYSSPGTALLHSHTITQVFAALLSCYTIVHCYICTDHQYCKGLLELFMYFSSNILWLVFPSESICYTCYKCVTCPGYIYILECCLWCSTRM